MNMRLLISVAKKVATFAHHTINDIGLRMMPCTNGELVALRVLTVVFAK